MKYRVNIQSMMDYVWNNFLLKRLKFGLIEKILNKRYRFENNLIMRLLLKIYLFE